MSKMRTHLSQNELFLIRKGSRRSPRSKLLFSTTDGSSFVKFMVSGYRGHTNALNKPAASKTRCHLSNNLLVTRDFLVRWARNYLREFVAIVVHDPRARAPMKVTAAFDKESAIRPEYSPREKIERNHLQADSTAHKRRSRAHRRAPSSRADVHHATVPLLLLPPLLVGEGALLVLVLCVPSFEGASVWGKASRRCDC